MDEKDFNEKDAEILFFKLDRVDALNRLLRKHVNHLLKGEKPTPLLRKRIARLLVENQVQKQAIADIVDFIISKGFAYPIPF